jgi:dephospho-CoA kinase
MNGDIDRVALGQIIFENPQAKKDLEAIIHPRIRAEFEEAVASLEADQIMVYEIPLLVETNAADRFDFIVTVESQPELRKERLRARGMFHSDIEKRMASQATEEQRREIADCVLTNNGSEDELLRQVENIWESTILPRAQK